MKARSVKRLALFGIAAGLVAAVGLPAGHADVSVGDLLLVARQLERRPGGPRRPGPQPHSYAGRRRPQAGRSSGGRQARRQDRSPGSQSHSYAGRRRPRTGRSSGGREARRRRRDLKARRAASRPRAGRHRRPRRRPVRHRDLGHVHRRQQGGHGRLSSWHQDLRRRRPDRHQRCRPRPGVQHHAGLSPPSDQERRRHVHRDGKAPGRGERGHQECRLVGESRRCVRPRPARL